MTRRTLLTRASKLGLAAYVGSLAAEAGSELGAWRS